MKITLAFLLCSYVAESCLPPYIHPVKFDSEYEPGIGYLGSFLVISPLSELNQTLILDSVQTNTVIKITNIDLSKTLSFTVESVTDFGEGRVQLMIASGSINYSSVCDK